MTSVPVNEGVERILPVFDDREWCPAFVVRQGPMLVIEYVPEGEAIEDSEEFITTISTPGAVDVPSGAEFDAAAGSRREFLIDGRFDSRIRKAVVEELLYEWSISGDLAQGLGPMPSWARAIGSCGDG